MTYFPTKSAITRWAEPLLAPFITPISFSSKKSIVRWAISLFTPIALWALLWLGITSGDFETILNSGNISQYLRTGLRPTLPLVAGTLSLGYILFRIYRRNPPAFPMFGPLTLTSVYGTVGLFAIAVSPQAQVSAYWNLTYLGIPMALFAIAWGGDAIGKAWRIVGLTWLLIILATTVLFIFAFVNLELGKTLITPSSWLECDLNKSWYGVTSGIIRSTGVGRYAALTGILAIILIWRQSWRPLWIPVLFMSLVLLWTSGARTSFIGFGAAVLFVIPLLGGHKAMLWSLAILAVFVIFITTAGFHRTAIDNCLLTEWSRPHPATETPSPSNTNHSASTAAETPLSTAAETPLSTAGDVAFVAPVIMEVTETNPVSGTNEEGEDLGINIPVLGKLPDGFFTFSGRTLVWEVGWNLFSESPVIGNGFHADRITLENHLHNAYLHALVQGGSIGALAFLAALVCVWYLLIRAIRELSQYPEIHRVMIIQSSGVLTFLTVRTVSESTGAFYGIDWLILAPIYLYFQVLRSDNTNRPQGSSQESI